MSHGGAHGVREEPQFVTAHAGENVILGCDVAHPLNGQPYVVEWFKFGVPIPFFINFRFYPPHVGPEYAGRASLHGKSSLRIAKVRSDDQGWYECKVLMLEQQYHTFHNGSWVHLTVNDTSDRHTASPGPWSQHISSVSSVLYDLPRALERSQSFRPRGPLLCHCHASARLTEMDSLQQLLDWLDTPALTAVVGLNVL
ncbi:hypothetical protein J4Q44_G00073260 [Coregonus suidteri]|uniref:Ig-like domain-containing protein n=1 Tax=Coregonus suidteri TaxID=861788 RepID=A0AAN8R3A7_9TELE